MKRVKYWAAQAAVDADFQPNSEVDRLDWLPLPAALDRLTRQTDRDLLRAFAAAPVDTVPVILLRHAEALPRKRWDGPESDRPLTGEGPGRRRGAGPGAGGVRRRDAGLLAVRAVRRDAEADGPRPPGPIWPWSRRSARAPTPTPGAAGCGRC